jgi:hypothetical protein
MCKTNITPQQEFLLKFFSDNVEPRQMAQSLRRATYLIALSFIRSEDGNNPMNKEWTDDSYYFLNELAEVLDPVLEDK